MTPFIQELTVTDPLQAFKAIRHLPYSLLFDSADRKHPNARYSFIVCHPIETIEAKGGKITITNWDEQITRDGEDPFALIKERSAHWVPETETVRGLPPFQGGAAGLFGYDLGRAIEKMPDTAADDPDIPDMAVGIYDQVLAFDHTKDQAWIITHARNYDEARKKQHFLLSMVTHPTPDTTFKPASLDWEPNFDAHDYKEQVRKVIEYIKDGDIFQANLTQRFDAQLPEDFDPFAHYLHLREINPAPFATYMNFGGMVLSSASPERFLTAQNGIVETRPIKGTRPHVEDPAIDQFYKNALQNSEKDKAENTMIVDLLRNDLSKVCKQDSIRVAELCKLESFASVHHLVSTVRGELKKDRDALDLLRACFPGGSITGAPKIRAMEIIEELEPTRRGPYCGAAGYVSFDGSMDANILIRTLVYKDDAVSFQTGGGVVADSNPDDEYQESFDKAEAIFRSFEDSKVEVEDEYLQSA